MTLVPYFLAAAFVGALVGAVEVFQRYRAEPLQAVANRWGVAYLVFNAAVAALAFYVAVLSANLGAGSARLTLLQWSAAAGFGGATLLRAKLLNVQLADGKEVAVGPELLVQTFLSVIDRELDRMRAEVRFGAVRRLMKGIDFERSKLRLPLQVFQAMQAVTEEETQALMDRVKEVDEMKTIEPQDKSYLLGYYLLDLVGERFLQDVLVKYKTDFEGPPAEPAEPAEPTAS